MVSFSYECLVLIIYKERNNDQAAMLVYLRSTLIVDQLEGAGVLHSNSF